MSRATLLVASLLLAAACRTIPPPVPIPPDDPRPRALLEAWAERANERQGLRGVARLAVDGEETGVRIRAVQIFAIERPSRLRVEVLGLLNQTLAVLVTDGERFELFRAKERSFETGLVHPLLLWQEAHLALTPEETVDLLLGAPMPDPELVAAAAERTSDGEIRVSLADADGALRQRVAFDADARLRWIEVRDPAGELAWRARYDDYSPVDGTPFAHAISLDVSTGGTHAEISLRDLELNPELSVDVFRLRPAALENAADADTR